MERYTALALITALVVSTTAQAQCGVGEVEVSIAITTDDFGYETYWQFVPSGNSCGNGTIFEGGNLTIGCSGGGLQAQEPSGYGNATMYMEGPWCLTEGALYDIFMVDDWGDGQAGVEVLVNGSSAVQFGVGEGPLNVYTFAAQAPVARDMEVTMLQTPIYARVGEMVRIRGTVKSLGSDPVTDFTLDYTVDGGPVIPMLVDNVMLSAGGTYDFTHEVPWSPTLEGTADVTVSIGSVNGSSDLNGFNDELTSHHIISPARPDLAAAYLAAEPVVNVIADSDQDLLVPRDLDFHPESSRNELWVINKDTEASGGSTVTFYNAGEGSMSHEWRHDVNAWHFMSLPTAIAMGDNNDFATSPGVFDANHNGGTPFTGPTLWSADTAIYCRFYGGLGSHLDMLHMDPQSQGIAHDFWNRYWVVDGSTGDIVMNDFRKDHGPGNDYHGNGIIRRYADFHITKDPNDHIVSHAVMDKATGWLYVVDHGGQRVLRLNTNTGTVSGPATEWMVEAVAEYTDVTGYDWEVIVSEGLVEPAGIELVGGHLYVSDHANGDIIVYDLSGSGAAELGRLHTGSPGLMGIAAGPDGRIWGVNATFSQLLRIDPQEPTGLNASFASRPICWPIPAKDRLFLDRTLCNGPGSYMVLDAVGHELLKGSLATVEEGVDTRSLSAGVYSLLLLNGHTHHACHFSVVR